MIAVLGAGAMGAALAVRWAMAGADVALLGTDFDTRVLAAVRDGRAHPALGVTLHPAVTCRSFDEWESVLAEAEVVVVFDGWPGADLGRCFVDGEPEHEGGSQLAVGRWT